MEIPILDKNALKLSVALKNTRALVVFYLPEKVYKVVDCSRKTFCRAYISQNCPPYCPVIVAVKDFVLKRREPKADVKLINLD